MENAPPTSQATSPAHTPLPWFVEDGPGLWIVTQDGWLITTLNEWNEEVLGHGDDRANARLIVRACNCHDDLLEACELLVRSLGNRIDAAGDHPPQDEDEQAMQKGVAAIVKAKAA